MARKIFITFFLGICVVGIGHALRENNITFANHVLVAGGIICGIALLSEIVRDFRESIKPRKTDEEIRRQKRLDAYGCLWSLFWWR